MPVGPQQRRQLDERDWDPHRRPERLRRRWRQHARATGGRRRRRSVSKRAVLDLRPRHRAGPPSGAATG